MTQELLYADLVFPQLERQLKADPALVKNVRGYFHVTTFRKPREQYSSSWHIVLLGQDQPPYISKQNPSPSQLPASLPKVTLELDDRDLLKLITGGMNGIKAYTTKKLHIKGDLQLAQEAEQVFTKAGGVKRVMAFIREQYPDFQPLKKKTNSRL